MTTTAPTGPRVAVTTTDGVTTIALDSPHNRNALSNQLVTELHAALAAAAADDAVRSVVLTHTGNTFCAGADLSEATSSSSLDPARERADQLIDLLRAIVALPKPVIGRIDGNVRAGGMGLVGACDIVIASDSSSFALTESRLGLAASVISLTLLPRVHPRAAERYFLTGEKFDAATAVAMGLVSEAVGDTASLDASVATITGELGLCSPQGLRESKAVVTHDVLAYLDANRDRVAAQSSSLFASDDAREGMTAFLERRKPRWAL
ncbi:enoyl-CoA hydratase family protein [Nocardioides sp. AE5]|uniref:enoyl-CoA hydratase family protein n=1 Tax=Nocardioides sp. AE5 TaxID=2962573 RepID=UPI0028826A73|nr:enoyl-CoA hydratase family protein [Nocardioides sp. AE5]MDT0203765.1 enoyl-CoA hydratase family protein [Nocardioides sp. AE5]